MQLRTEINILKNQTQVDYSKQITQLEEDLEKLRNLPLEFRILDDKNGDGKITDAEGNVVLELTPTEEPASAEVFSQKRKLGESVNIAVKGLLKAGGQNGSRKTN